MKEVLNELNVILQEVPRSDFENMTKYVEMHYSRRGYNVDKAFLKDFFENNYSAGIWDEALSESLSKKHNDAIRKLIGKDWMRSDFINSHIGSHVINVIIKFK